MKTLKQLGVILMMSVFMLVLASQSIKAQKDESTATLQETLEWMKSKLDGNAVVVVFEEPDSYDKQAFKKWYYYYTYGLVKIDGCTLSYKVKTEWTWLDNNPRMADKQAKSEPFTLARTINFAKLDPLDVRVLPWTENIYGEKEFRFKENAWGIDLKPRDDDYYPRINFGTKEMAERFAKAAAHAVRLCGGKVEPF